MDKLYIHTEQYHNLKSPRLVVPIVLAITSPKSVLDVGCGIGTWLKVFEEYGIKDYVGVDGEYVDRSMLEIPKYNFRSQDLRKKWDLKRKFDLVVSLEVAEHLPAECANEFVESLIIHGDTILFSAAIPGQGGQNHINEQPLGYWESKFEKHGFFFHDVIRPLIWENGEIEWWYRQNIFLVKRNLPLTKPLFTIHPELFYSNLEYHQKLLGGNFGVKLGIKIFLKSLMKKMSI
jgi:SAM-dependent methyltransferase